MKTYTIILVFSLFLSAIALSQALAAPSGYELIKKFEAEERGKPTREIARDKVEYTSTDKPDPFESNDSPARRADDAPKPEPAKVEIVPPSLSVQGIIWGGIFPQAIINNKVVKEGDALDGVRVIKIEKSGIRIFYQEKEFVLPPPSGVPSVSQTRQGGPYAP